MLDDFLHGGGEVLGLVPQGLTRNILILDAALDVLRLIVELRIQLLALKIDPKALNHAFKGRW